MTEKYVRRSLAFAISGQVLQFGCVYLIKYFAARSKAGATVPPEAFAYILLGGLLLGVVLWIIGLSFFAKAKGYGAIMGLVGLASCLGLLILAVLPDKTKGQKATIAE